jgi:imidazole glycerol-phosphate synthase subunit HisH
MIGIVDYGAGNIASVRHAFARIGEAAEPFSDPRRALDYSRLLLPGVGSFRLAMESLRSAGWEGVLREYAASGRPVMGICLGMQLLLDVGLEHGDTAGLGLIPGTVERLAPAPGYKVPHTGWNSITHDRPHPLLRGLRAHIDFYFVHSFHCNVTHPENVIARCDYGGSFVAGIARGNVAGFQFHPEKSQPMGLKVLQRFAEWGGES